MPSTRSSASKKPAGAKAVAAKPTGQKSAAPKALSASDDAPDAAPLSPSKKGVKGAGSPVKVAKKGGVRSPDKKALPSKASPTKRGGRKPKSAALVESEGEATVLQTPPASSLPPPQTPRGKRNRLFLESNEAFEAEVAASPSPTKRLRTMVKEIALKDDESEAEESGDSEDADGSGDESDDTESEAIETDDEDEDDVEVDEGIEDDVDDEADEAAYNDSESDEEEDVVVEEVASKKTKKLAGKGVKTKKPPVSGQAAVDGKGKKKKSAVVKKSGKGRTADPDESDSMVLDEVADDDDPFATVSAKKTSLNKLKEKTNLVVQSLPSSDGIPLSIRDAGLYQRFPDVEKFNLRLGSIDTWMDREPANAIKGLVSLNTYRPFAGDNKLVMKNIYGALSFSQDGVFYNAAFADPRGFVAHPLYSSEFEQYELITADTGDVAVGLFLGAFKTSTLRGTLPDGHKTRALTVIPHRGLYERFSSFHCMHLGVKSVIGQVVGTALSFQTQGKPYKQAYSPVFLNDDSGEDEPNDEEALSDLEVYDSPTKAAAPANSSERYRLDKAYGIDERVPILDGTETAIKFTSGGIRSFLATAQKYKGVITLRSPCLVAYNFYAYRKLGSSDKYKVKFNVMFVAVLAIAPPKK